MENLMYYETLDLVAKLYRPIRIKQRDTKRGIVFSFTANGRAYDISGAKLCTIYIRKPDGKRVFNDLVLSAEDNTATFLFTDQSVVAAGTARADVRLYDSEGKTISSMPFDLIIEESCYDENAVESTDEYKALEKAVSWMDAMIDGGALPAGVVSVPDGADVAADQIVMGAGDKQVKTTGYIIDDGTVEYSPAGAFRVTNDTSEPVAILIPRTTDMTVASVDVSMRRESGGGVYFEIGNSYTPGSGNQVLLASSRDWVRGSAGDSNSQHVDYLWLYISNNTVIDIIIHSMIDDNGNEVFDAKAFTEMDAVTKLPEKKLAVPTITVVESMIEAKHADKYELIETITVEAANLQEIVRTVPHLKEMAFKATVPTATGSSVFVFQAYGENRQDSLILNSTSIGAGLNNAGARYLQGKIFVDKGYWASEGTSAMGDMPSSPQKTLTSFRYAFTKDVETYPYIGVVVFRSNTVGTYFPVGTVIELWGVRA